MAEGKIFESLVNEILNEYFDGDDKVTLLSYHGYWQDCKKSENGKVAEIDLVVHMKGWGYIWGTCKRSARKLGPQNITPHLANLPTEILENQRHRVVYLAPVISPDLARKLEKQVPDVDHAAFEKIFALDLKSLLDEDLSAFDHFSRNRIELEETAKKQNLDALLVRFLPNERETLLETFQYLVKKSGKNQSGTVKVTALQSHWSELPETLREGLVHYLVLVSRSKIKKLQN